MGRSGKKPLLENIEITDIAAEGKAIGKHDGCIVFVSNCVPGDIVNVQVVRNRKRFMEGYPVKFHTYSKNRSQPFCPHFGICGGCKWQHLPYDNQLKYKQKQVEDSLQRIGKSSTGTFLPIAGSKSTLYYRNKLEFTFSNNRWLTPEEIGSETQFEHRNALGFHIPGKFDKVLDIEKCFLQPEPSNQIRTFVKNYALEHGLGFYNLVTQQGLLRNLIIRNNTEGGFMVILSVTRYDEDKLIPLFKTMSEKFPQIKSLQYVVNAKANDTINDLDVKVFSGEDHLTEKIEDLVFRISPKSFFQTNTQQALQLYEIVRDFAGLSGNEIVYDLYTGTGTIALFLARRCLKIRGIEHVPEAIADAEINADINNIKNAEFYASDIKDTLTTEFMDRHGYPDVIITDPPRSGMHADVVKAILAASPKKIVYVSCNPATQARDIALMSDQYGIVKSRPVDMFPFTHHVENVLLLEKSQDKL